MSAPLIKGPMVKGPMVKGWCPGALRPMMSGDGLVLRVRPKGGRLSRAQLAGIADLAATHGNGLIDLSNRANLQIRGGTPQGHATVIEGLRELGCLDPDPEAEARRNIMVSPFWSNHDQSQPLHDALAIALAGPDAPQLPGKFGFSIDLTAENALAGAGADIHIEAHVKTGKTGFLIRPSSFITGAWASTPQKAADHALTLAHWFSQTDHAQNGRGRMATLWPDLPPKMRHSRLLAPFQTTPAQQHITPPEIGPYPQGFLIGFAFGQLTAQTLRDLAPLGAWRLTPWRMVLIENLKAAPDLPGLITNPDDPRLRVVACTGAPGCQQALGATRPLAHALAPHVPPGKKLHVSGCTKGCAHPGPADFTLVATDAGFALLHKAAPAARPDDIQPAAALTRTPSLLFGNPDAS